MSPRTPAIIRICGAIARSTSVKAAMAPTASTQAFGLIHWKAAPCRKPNGRGGGASMLDATLAAATAALSGATADARAGAASGGASDPLDDRASGVRRPLQPVAILMPSQIR